MAGLDVLGRSYYGYLPLRGKLLNVREASKAKYTPNEEINNIIKILGLQWNKSYEGDNYAKSLRYGKVMIMADQDYDGSHIKGLLINLFHKFWPALLKAKGFLSQFITPIIKATNKGNPDQFEQFFSIREFEDWWKTLDNGTEWSITYYKGLGTFSREEGKVYFQNLDKHRRYFVWDDDAEKKIELAFSKKKIDERKECIQRHMDSQPDSLVNYYHHKEIKYSDFFEKEYIEFCIASLQRSIPSMVDGLKRTQRKILFCAFKKNLIKSEGFSQFSGYVAEHSAYHHGADNIANVIVGMAQNFVGSNNINLFIPDDDHGTREQGGKHHAAARYISTRLSPITRFIFTEDDDASLVYLNEEGKKVEPKSYLPIIPMVLVNGCEGIGVGSSTYVPN